MFVGNYNINPNAYCRVRDLKPYKNYSIKKYVLHKGRSGHLEIAHYVTTNYKGQTMWACSVYQIHKSINQDIRKKKILERQV